MTPKNPVGKLTDTALNTLKDPKAAAGRLAGPAKSTVALGRAVGSTAGAVVGHAAGKLTERVGGRRHQPAAPGNGGAPASPRGGLRAVPEVNEPAATQPPGTAVGTADSPKPHGDALAPTKKASAKKRAAKKTAAKKGQATPGVSRTPAAPSPAEVAEVVEAAVAEDPRKTAAQPRKRTTAKKSSARTGAAKKSTAKKSSPGGKLPPARKAQGASSKTQPGTEPVVDPATAKRVASESEKLRKAAENNPE